MPCSYCFFIFFFSIVGIIVRTVVINNPKFDHSPMTTAWATVVSKRAHLVGRHVGSSGLASFDPNPGVTVCLVTFQLASPVASADGAHMTDRVELVTSVREFRSLVIGEAGTLTYQRNRYRGLARNITTEPGVPQ
jgi:hypothetical protein